MKVILTFPSMLHGKAWSTRPGKCFFSANKVYFVSPKRIEYLVHIFSKEKESINAKQNMGTHLESWSPPRCLYISIYTNFSHKNQARHTPHVRLARRGRRRWEGLEIHRNQMLEDVSAPKQFFFLPSTVPAGHTLLIGLFFAPVSLRSPPYYFFMSQNTRTAAAASERSSLLCAWNSGMRPRPPVRAQH